jgi:hypothetical protein
VHAADDDSVPVPQDAFRFPSGAVKWRTPFLVILIGLGGLYGLLVLIGRLSPSLLGRPESASAEALQLPLLVQLSSAFAGLAALVLVLTRAVREVDKRPYVAIAPVLAVFAALVHAGLRVDLSQLGMSSALVAFGALAVALLGGALIVRDEERLRWIGWGLVLAPCAWLAIVLDIVKGQAPFESSERAYLAGLFVSTLLMGGAGVAARKLRAELLRDAAPPRMNLAALPARRELSQAVTMVAPAFRQPMSRDTARLAMPAPARSGAGRARTAAMLLVVAIATYLTVGGLRRGGNDAPADAARAAMVPAGPPVVEQLNSGRRPGDAARSLNAARRDNGSRGADKPRASKSAAARSEVSLAHGPARSDNRLAPVSAPAKGRSASPAKPTRGARAAGAAPPKVALPAWGNEALREFDSPKGGAKPSKIASSKPAQQVEPAPAPAPTQYKTTFATKVEKPKPLEPPKPVEPPKPTKPMTMEQVLDQVEKSAQAQRKKAGAKQGAVDPELEALINGTMKKKGK